MTLKPVKFALLDGVASLRISMPGGYQLELDAGKPHETAEPHEIAALDEHPAAERLPAKEAAKP